MECHVRVLKVAHVFPNDRTSLAATEIVGFCREND